MSFTKKKGYEDNDSLQKLAEMLAGLLPELSDAMGCKWKVIYSASEPEHIGGKCRRLDGAIKHTTGLDYLILIHKGPFQASDEREKMRILCHELFHIERETEHNSLKVRKHEGDFCEIAAHDRWSYSLADKALEAILPKPTDTSPGAN